jgi:predicted ABC-type sugar transport system permease subunit
MGITMKTEGMPSPAEKGNPSEHKPSVKERAAYELKEFLGMFIYLWVLFALFSIHKSMILSEEHINYRAQGIAVINALIMAKAMLIGEDLHVGSWLKDKPVLYSSLYKSLVFSVFLIAFYILEEVVVGVFRGRTISQSFPAIGGGSLQGLLSMGAIVFVSLIPFFAFRELARVIGQRELWSLLLKRGTRVYTLQSGPQ